jgi:hypothetical protein
MENEKCRIKADGCWELGVGLIGGSGVQLRRNSEDKLRHMIFQGYLK